MSSYPWQAVSFDLDGTLAEYTGDFEALVDTVRLELGLIACDFRGFFTRLTRELAADGHLTLELALARLLDGLGLSTAGFDLEELAGRKCREYAQQVRLRPGAIDLLDRLSAAGIPVALLSNGPVDMQRAAVVQLGLERYFRTVLISGDRDVAARKPQPRIFYLACTGLRSVPEETVMVGDNLQADIEGALSYGLAAVRLGGTEADDGRFVTVSTLAEVAEILLPDAID